MPSGSRECNWQHASTVRCDGGLAETTATTSRNCHVPPTPGTAGPVTPERSYGESPARHLADAQRRANGLPRATARGNRTSKRSALVGRPVQRTVVRGGRPRESQKTSNTVFSSRLLARARGPRAASRSREPRPLPLCQADHASATDSMRASRVAMGGLANTTATPSPSRHVPPTPGAARPVSHELAYSESPGHYLADAQRRQ